jgi:hypothetical protein
LNDSWVEEVSRWAAARYTRRSFLGKAGRAAIMVAGGPLLATLLAETAYAKVCGQTGVSVPCPTFDCDAVWGWCWYASGCCADGSLKKICDCCEANYPNVHGYCPDGTNVRCLVESCGTDPRVQTVPVHRVSSDDRIPAAAAIRRVKFPSGSSTVVIADAEDDLIVAVATALAGILGVPVVAVNRLLPGPDTLSGLREMGARTAKLVGPSVVTTVDLVLALNGVSVERVGNSPDPATLSAQVAQWASGQAGAPGASVCVIPAGISREAAGLAASFAAAKRWPLVLGAGAARSAGVPTYLVGPEAAAISSEVPAPTAFASASLFDLAHELVRFAHSSDPVPGAAVVAPAGARTITELGGMGAPVLLYRPGSLDGVREWLVARANAHGLPTHAVLAEGAAGSVGTQGLYELQSLVNGYAVHKLVGVGGQGLPIIEQPPEERPLGLARVGPAPSRGRR